MKQKLKRLDQLCEGEAASLQEILPVHPLRIRLLDMGWFDGAHVRCIRHAPWGDPIAYRTAGVTVALRRRDAAMIYVRDTAHREGE